MEGLGYDADADAKSWAKMIEGPVTSQVPASALQLHPWTIAISDVEAASQLNSVEYYQRVERTPIPFRHIPYIASIIEWTNRFHRSRGVSCGMLNVPQSTT